MANKNEGAFSEIGASLSSVWSYAWKNNNKRDLSFMRQSTYQQKTQTTGIPKWAQDGWNYMTNVRNTND